MRLRSEVALFDHRTSAGDEADVELVHGDPRPVPQDRPGGRVVAELGNETTRLYTAAVAADGSSVFRFYGLADFEIDADATNVVCRPDPAAREDLLPVIVGGNLIAFLLLLRGHCVLHASAVELDGQAVAFVGGSGMGKSTVAALMCARAASLVTDDVLRVDVADGLRCRLGASAVRLRDRTEEIAAEYRTTAQPRLTADGRHAVSPPRPSQHPPVLRAIAIPHISREGHAVTTERLSSSQALLALLSFPRLYGFNDPVLLGQQFELLATLAEAVPTVRLHVPWGPPFPSSLPYELTEVMSGYLSGGASGGGRPS